MTIAAKFAGRCAVCGERFAAGTRIEWQRGQGTRHADPCQPAAKPASSKPARVAKPADLGRVYQCVCHGCGTFHEYRAHFLSVPMVVRMPAAADGSQWSLPALGCPACMALVNPDRSTHPIARAFDHGMSAASVARMHEEWPAVQARLEAAKGQR